MGTHSIIVIRNKEGKYLQYYDKVWNCYLFLNCKMSSENDIEVVKNKISNDLHIEKSAIKVSFIGKKQHKKYSESAKMEKEYTHLFYSITVRTQIQENDFEINNIKYKWFSYSDLLNDERIQKVNSDIVKFIKEFNI